MKMFGATACLAPSTALFFALAGPPIAATADSGLPSPKKTTSPSVETVHLEPRRQNYMPNSAEDNDIQRRLSIFNEKQGLEDLALDKKLRICRGC
jgi:hypothetical protein